MNKTVAGVAGAIAVAALGFVGAVAMQPASLDVERSLVMDASPDDIFGLVNDYAEHKRWDPWAAKDPNQVVTLTDPSFGVGAGSEWKGNDEVGEGKQVNTKVTPNTEILSDLTFIKPFESTAKVYWTFTPEGDKTKVVWGFNSPQGFMGKMAGLFMDMEAMVGADFEAGLAKLEEEAKKERVTRLAADVDRDQKAIKATMASSFSTLTDCYETARESDPGLAGSVDVTFTVTAGAVSDTEVSTDTLGNADVVACITSTIGALVFDETVNGDVTYPLVFVPQVADAK